MRIDALLKIYSHMKKQGAVGTVRGESADAWYTDAIGISGFEFGGGDTEGDEFLKKEKKVRSDGSLTFAPFGFKVNKEIDRASPHLFRAYALTYSKRTVPTRNYFPSAEVIFRKVGGTRPLEYMTITFGGVLLTSYSLNVDEEGASKDGVGKETVGFRFQSCEMTYSQQAETGNVAPAPEQKGWDYEANTRI